MIVCKLIGGLGNQMFSYAVGRALSLEKKTELLIDKSWVDMLEERKNIDLFALKYFEVYSNLKFRNKRDQFSKYDSRIATKLLRIIEKRVPYHNKSIVFERGFNYQPQIFEVKAKDIYLKSGYWQSYKYFEKYENTIRNDFKFSKSVQYECKDLAEEIMSRDNSVSIHIRRGDYEKNPRIAKVHGGICTIEYYMRAIEYIEDRIKGTVFYVFSDDMDWVKANFKGIKNIQYIEKHIETREEEIGHRDKGYCDMYLMSLCKHNIIANSSFSWWGAWLNNNPNKIVIAPKKWFNDDKDTSDLIPESWIKIATN